MGLLNGWQEIGKPWGGSGRPAPASKSKLAHLSKRDIEIRLRECRKEIRDLETELLRRR